MKTLPLLIILLIFIMTSCDSVEKSIDTIYIEQEKLFIDNRETFESAAHFLNASSVFDTSLLINDKHLQLPDSITKKLMNVGISEVIIFRTDCKTKDIRFVPDSLWYNNMFSVLQIHYNNCDERSKLGYHWTLPGSEHKHSFGQGNSWFIYSDTDRDPF